MFISQILKNKGGDVITVSATAAITDVVDRLAERNFGALVVSEDGVSVDGIISERDIVRQLSSEGTGCLKRTAGELMTAKVITCSSESIAEDLLATMTAGRFRHMPVVDDGKLVGIVSIGDIVNVRLRELEVEREQLTNYITGR